jgi:hypothetical protein
LISAVDAIDVWYDIMAVDRKGAFANECAPRKGNEHKISAIN